MTTNDTNSQPKLNHEETMLKIKDCKSRFCIGLNDEESTIYYDINIEDPRKLGFALSIALARNPQYVEAIAHGLSIATNNDNYLKTFLIDKKKKESR